MAKLNNTKNTVRFTFFHTSDQNEMCTGMKRGRWKSEENLKRLDTLDRPPRRPSRDQAFLNNIAEEFFISNLAESDEEDECQPQSRKMPRSILKTTSKYNSPAPAHAVVKTKKYRRSSKTRFDRRSDYSSSSESSNSDISEEKPTLLMNKHKDSILDLPKLTYRCKPKLKHDGLTSPLSMPSLVCLGDEDECDPSQISSGSSNFDSTQGDTSDQSIGLEL